jgi:hypothetical protein
MKSREEGKRTENKLRGKKSYREKRQGLKEPRWRNIKKIGEAEPEMKNLNQRRKN